MVLEIFANKYRPKRLSEFHIDPDLYSVLSGLVQTDSLNVILYGPSGSGKTSIIYALLKEYYGFDIPITHPNILKISILKEYSLTYFRSDIRNFCQTTSTIHGKQKMLVIDDIDMINEQSQQILRRYIDTYRNNVMFVMSCKDIYKVIDSIQSRLTILCIPEKNSTDLKSIIQNVTEKEQITLSEEVIQFLLDISNGSLRILLNYLEKIKLFGAPIDIDLAVQLCTNISFHTLSAYTRACQNSNIPEAVQCIVSWLKNGYSGIDILDNYFVFLKHTKDISEDHKSKLVPCICKYITIFYTVHEDDIELFFFTNNVITIFNLE